MAKAKITMIVELEYEINEDSYKGIDGCETLKDMVNFDVEAYREMPDMILSYDRSKISIKGELIEE
jgi:hypothetical protein